MSGNADVWERYIETCNDSRWDELDSFVTDRLLVDGTECARADFLESLRKDGECFGESVRRPERVVEAGDWLTVVLRTRGRHVGGWHGLAPSGAVVDSREIALYRFDTGRIAEVWTVADDLATYLALSSSVDGVPSATA